MGMYDSLYVSCPQCSTVIEFQSKAGDCVLAEYTLSNVPADIAGDLDGDSESCPKCSSVVTLKTQCVVTVHLHNLRGSDEDRYWIEDDEPL